MKRICVLLFLAACAREEAIRPPTGTASQAEDTASTTVLAEPATPPAPAVNGPKLAFIDETLNDPSFAAYREQLLTAVRARDAKKVLALSDPNIRTSFGGEVGRTKTATDGLGDDSPRTDQRQLAN